MVEDAQTDQTSRFGSVWVRPIEVSLFDAAHGHTVFVQVDDAPVDKHSETLCRCLYAYRDWNPAAEIEPIGAFFWAPAPAQRVQHKGTLVPAWVDVQDNVAVVVL